MAPAVANVASANGDSVQEKRYRSMQEHIRRAHPEHYISKLPATEESFQLMISTPPSERPPPPLPPPPPPTGSIPSPHGYGNDRHSYQVEPASTPNTPRIREDFRPGSMPPAASAAAALAQLHNHKFETEWESDGVRGSRPQIPEHPRPLTTPQDWMSDTEARKQVTRRSIELPPLPAGGSHPREPTSDPFSHLSAQRRRELLPSILSTSPPGRSSTLPPIQRTPAPTRPRKQSVSKRAREPPHRRQKSRGEIAHLRGLSYERKAFSAEPSCALSAAYGKRWEDLIDAATSATEDVDDDRTRPFPSVESGESGETFHVKSRGLSDSSPSFSSQSTQIYCAACQGVSRIKESYACTECICGICQACVEVLVAEQGARRKCPRCATVGGRFKPFQLDIR
ncbi:hypothetical protein PZA11_000491 [Diplocarpon coronariae]